MPDFNRYINRLDYRFLIEFFVEQGTMRQYKRGEKFCSADTPCKYLGYVQSGAFQYCVTAGSGAEHVVGYAFVQSFVGNYASFQLQEKSAVEIKAICASEVYVVTYEQLDAFYAQNAENMMFARKVSDLLFSDIYSRLIAMYTQTPEERYKELISRCPNILNLTPLKNLASYLAIRPETLSRLRKKLAFS